MLTARLPSFNLHASPVEDGHTKFCEQRSYSSYKQPFPVQRTHTLSLHKYSCSVPLASTSLHFFKILSSNFQLISWVAAAFSLLKKMGKAGNKSCRFVTEVAPPKLASVVKHKAVKKRLDTIEEEESCAIEDLSTSFESIPSPNHWLQDVSERMKLVYWLRHVKVSVYSCRIQDVYCNKM